MPAAGRTEAMKRRVLFTGNGKLVVDDLIEHIPSFYEKFTCAPTEVAFRKALEDYRPHVIVIGLLKCTEVTLEMYAALKDYNEYANIPMIAVGNESDCDLFYKHVFQKNMKTFERPLDRQGFLQTLDDFSAIAANYEESQEAKREEEEARKKEEQAALQADIEEKKLMREIQMMNMERGRKSILVVDDDVRMLGVIKLYLQDLYDVTVVPSGKLALKFLNKKDADLVLLDYMMPEMDGPEVLRQIREDSPSPSMPVVFLTGVSDREKVMKGLEFHPNGYLLKPVKRLTLLEKVTEILLGL